MSYNVTIEQHRRDYSGTLRRPVATASFETVDDAKSFVLGWFAENETAYRFAVIEQNDGPYYASTSTDGPYDLNDFAEYGTDEDEYVLVPLTD